MICRASISGFRSVTILSDHSPQVEVGVATVGIFIYWYCFDEGTDGISTLILAVFTAVSASGQDRTKWKAGLLHTIAILSNFHVDRC